MVETSRSRVDEKGRRKEKESKRPGYTATNTRVATS